MMLIIIFTLMINGALFAENFGDFFEVSLVRVIDGDTVVVSIPQVHALIGDDIAVRVAGIDTPELRGKCEGEKQQARQAKQFVESVLKDGREISLHAVERGKYFRLVAEVRVDGQSLGAMLLSRSLAKYYTGNSKPSWCE